MQIITKKNIRICRFKNFFIIFANQEKVETNKQEKG